MIDKDKIQFEIQKLYNITPDNIHGVSYGFKIVNGQTTKIPCITFTVYEKLPKDAVPKNDLLPKFINIDGQDIQTDVIAASPITAFNSKCYSSEDSSSDDHRSPHVPNLKGGISVSNSSIVSAGTLGAIVLDNEDGSFAGLTNAHVVFDNGDNIFINSQKLNILDWDIRNGLMCQPGPLDVPGYVPGTIIGQIKRYYPYKRQPLSNEIDAALIGFYDNGVLASLDAARSQLNLSTPQSLNNSTFFQFARTSEINKLLGNQTVRKSGRTSGANNYNNSCPLEVTNVFGTYTVKIKGFDFVFSNCLAVQHVNYINSTNPYDGKSYQVRRRYPGAPGDSGSAVLATVIDSLTGQPTVKIIGLLFAGTTEYYGPGAWGPEPSNVIYICRIDEIASRLNVSALSSDSIYINDPVNWSYIIKTGARSDLILYENDKKYWQAGSDANEDSVYVTYGSSGVLPPSDPPPSSVVPIESDCCYSKIQTIDLDCKPSSICVVNKDDIANQITIGLAGWDVELGRVASFGNTMDMSSISDTTYVKLLKNTISWLTKEKENPQILIIDQLCDHNECGQGTLTAKPEFVRKYFNQLVTILEKVGDVTRCPKDIYEFSVSSIPSSYDLIIMLNSTYTYIMSPYGEGYIPDNTQQAIIDFVKQGGGLLFTEINYFYNNPLINSILPVDFLNTTWASPSKIIAKRNTSNEIIDIGLPETFSFDVLSLAPPGDRDFVRMNTTLKPGATTFYDFIIGTGPSYCMSYEEYNQNPEDYVIVSGPHSATKCRLSCYCDLQWVAPPTSIGDLEITYTSTGPVYKKDRSTLSCGNIKTLNSIKFGYFYAHGEEASVTIHFNMPVNDFPIAIVGMGQVGDEIFDITTNSGIPTINSIHNCYITNIYNNHIIGGSNAQEPYYTDDGTEICCGGGIFEISAPNDYTSITISGIIAHAGSSIAVPGCEYTLATPTPTPTPTPEPTEPTLPPVSSCGDCGSTSFWNPSISEQLEFTVDDGSPTTYTRAVDSGQTGILIYSGSPCNWREDYDLSSEVGSTCTVRVIFEMGGFPSCDCNVTGNDCTYSVVSWSVLSGTCNVTNVTLAGF